MTTTSSTMSLRRRERAAKKAENCVKSVFWQTRKLNVNAVLKQVLLMLTILDAALP